MNRSSLLALIFVLTACTSLPTLIPQPPAPTPTLPPRKVLAPRPTQPAPSARATSPTPTTSDRIGSGAAPAPDLVFIPDPGMRVENATNPAASLNAAGVFYLFFEQRSGNEPGKQMVATSNDGLNFASPRPPTPQDNPHHPFYLQLPDGTWRKFLFDPRTSEMRSESSRDGVNYTPDPGTRYKAQPSDNGTIGVRDIYVDPAGGVVMLYIGDMQGVNNIRRAYSPPGDNGMNFVLEDDNVLGDKAQGGRNTYVDPKSILLPDGRRRLFVMSQGTGPRPPLGRCCTISSFISSDGKTYTPEPGTRLTYNDFSEFQVNSLNDPVVVRLSDGRYRMYVAAMIILPDGKNKWAVVSATTRSTAGTGPATPPRNTLGVQSERVCLPEKKSIGVPDPNGPAFHQVLVAKSSDGLIWQTDNRVIIDQASVPEGLRLADGRWIIYAVDGTALGGPGLMYAESKDEGKTWRCGKINVQGADPDVVMLPDGKLRLYFVEFPFGPNPPPPGSAQSNQPNRVKSAISSDGKNFTLEEGVRLEGVQYTDPDVIRVGSDWFMYVSTGMTAWVAQSSDGLAFKLIGKVNETGAVSGSFVFPDGTLRHYFCGHGGILSGTSVDGTSVWKEESGVRIGQTQNVKIVCDPSLLSDGKGGYWMVYKIQPK